METCVPTPRKKIFARIFWSVSGAFLLAGLLFLLAFADALGFFHEPPLRLEQSGSTLTAHVERLGEYYSPVGRIRIQESDSGQVVYEAVAAKWPPEVFNFRLAAGANPTRLMGDDSDSYNVIEPRRVSTFLLKSGVRYRLTVWGDSWTFSRANFVL